MTEPKASHVYGAIAAITAALSKAGIAKDRKNQSQGYDFRGIDDVYLALSPLLAEYKLCIIPRVRERVVTERETQKGGVLFSVTVLVDFDLVSAVDGSTHTATMYGEAMDSGDKATNKAMSAAYKYMALEVFCIPTEGDNDADAQTHEVKAKSRHADIEGEVRLPGDATKFNGHGGKALTDPTIPTEELLGIGKWLEKKDPLKNKVMVAMIAEVLELRRTKDAA